MSKIRKPITSQWSHHDKVRWDALDSSLKIKETRHKLYGFKILDLFWFEEDLPDDLRETIHYFMRSDWPTEETPLPITGMMSLSESDMRFICQRLKRPKWIRSHCLRGKIKLADVSILFMKMEE